MSESPLHSPCDALIYEYLSFSYDRLLAERLVRGNTAISSIVDKLQRKLERVGLQELYEAKSCLWEELHCVHWKDTYDIDRELFGLVSAVIAVLLHQRAFDSTKTLQILDCGLLLGSERTQQLINEIMSTIRENRVQPTSGDVSPARELLANTNVHDLRDLQSRRRMVILTETDNPLFSTIATQASLDLLAFHNKYLSPQLPVVIQDCMGDWPAMQHYSNNPANPTNWGCISYLLDVLGHRTVPIETGVTYLSEDSGSCFITGEKFIRNYLLGEGQHLPTIELKQEPQTEAQENTCTEPSRRVKPRIGKTQSPKPLSDTVLSEIDIEREMNRLPLGYLAQHQLLEQIPELRRDLVTPDYCALLLDVDEEQDEVDTVGSDSEGQKDQSKNRSGVPHGADEVLVNAWLGPVGTVSPLHHDPYYNLLAQTAGTNQ